MMARWLVASLCLAVLGCGGERKDKLQTCEHKSMGDQTGARGGAQVRVTGFVAHDRKTGVDVPIDLRLLDPNGLPFAPNVLIRLPHEIALQVRDGDVQGEHRYEVLLGPYYPRDELGIGEVHTSAATASVQVGFIVVMGKLPLAQSKWVDTSSETTQWGIWIERAEKGGPEQHLVFNLEPKGSHAPIRVNLRLNPLPEPEKLMPGEYFEATASTLTRRRLPDWRADYMLKRARLAGLPVQESAATARGSDE